MQLCTISVVVGVDTDTRPGDDSCRIISQWRDVSAEEKRMLREKLDEILRPLGLRTRLIVLERANSMATLFSCLTLSSLQDLRDYWSSQRLKQTVDDMFTYFGTAQTLYVKRITWPRADYERCVSSFNLAQGKHTIGC